MRASLSTVLVGIVAVLIVASMSLFTVDQRQKAKGFRLGGDELRANDRLKKTVNASLRGEFGKRTVHDVVSGERDKIMEVMREKVDEDARKIGVGGLDVRRKREVGG